MLFTRIPDRLHIPGFPRAGETLIRTSLTLVLQQVSPTVKPTSEIFLCFYPLLDSHLAPPFALCRRMARTTLVAAAPVGVARPGAVMMLLQWGCFAHAAPEFGKRAMVADS
jgi:hypothetical protein